MTARDALLVAWDVTAVLYVLGFLWSLGCLLAWDWAAPVLTKPRPPLSRVEFAAHLMRSALMFAIWWATRMAQ